MKPPIKNPPVTLWAHIMLGMLGALSDYICYWSKPWKLAASPYLYHMKTFLFRSYYSPAVHFVCVAGPTSRLAPASNRANLQERHTFGFFRSMTNPSSPYRLILRARRARGHCPRLEIWFDLKYDPDLVYAKGMALT